MEDNNTPKIQLTPDGTWMLRNYTIANTEVTFEMLVYDPELKTITGYIFADTKKDFDNLTKLIDDNNGPNNYVDYCFIVVGNNELLKTAKLVFNYWSKQPPKTFNVGLYVYNEDDDSLSEQISATKNGEALFLKYIKPLEVSRIEAFYQRQQSAPTKRISTSPVEVDLVNYQESEWKNSQSIKTNGLDEVQTTSSSSQIPFDQSDLPEWILKKDSHLLNANDYQNKTKELDARASKLTQEITDMNISQASLLEEIDRYKSDLNNTNDLFNELKSRDLEFKTSDFTPNYDSSKIADLDELNYLEQKNNSATEPLLYDSDEINSNSSELPSDLIDYHDHLMNNSEYYQKLESITNSLQTHDFSEQTKQILEDFDLDKED
ncbi:hypothetical protein [[Mycoplasma] testudinis]|uniref:hypothetical protein n=1 Tax=[Mycoplasma] testudinis TaxID=33924 RepID=UPI000482487F|nr:hypothetical protein [[Mycoplasma] testudinis]